MAYGPWKANISKNLKEVGVRSSDILRCFIFQGKLFYADQLSDHFKC